MNDLQAGNSDFYIFEYPTAPSHDGYYFVVKNKNSHQLITLTARYLITERQDILKTLTLEESNRVYYYYGLEEAAQKARDKQLIARYQTTENS